jgi:hypothetical protein
MQKQLAVETLALAFAASAVVSFAIGFLQIAGAPAINWTLVWVVMGLSWIAAGFLAGRRYR